MFKILVSKGILKTEDLSFPVHILDTRKRYGNTDFLVTPVNGEGEKWVSAERVFINEG